MVVDGKGIGRRVGIERVSAGYPWKEDVRMSRMYVCIYGIAVDVVVQ